MLENLNSLNLNTLLDNNILIYPNPYIDGFFVKNFHENTLKIDIFNIMGHLVFSTYVDKEEAVVYISQTSSFSSGVYFLQTNNSTNFQTLMKLHE